MRAFTAICELSRSAFGAVVIGMLLSAGVSRAQQIQFGFGNAPTQIELTAPHVDVISGAVSARLEQARALTAARNWDEAIDIYRELAADSSGRVVALDDGRYVSLRTYCHLQLARLPADGLAAYRRRVDATAQRWYQEGVTNRDERRLSRIADEMFCSSWGDDALMALGELALERGDYATARRAWEQISPLLRAPNGMPLWHALRNIDLKSKWPDVERRWQAREQAPDWLAYPDTTLDLADVRARLLLASIRAGQFERAGLELEVFRRLHPNAAGQLGGQRENYVTALDGLVSSALQWPDEPAKTDWPTFGGSPTRGKLAAPVGSDLMPAWKEPIPLTPPTFSRSVQVVQGGAFGSGLIVGEPGSVVRESQRPLSCYPVVVDGVVVFADGSGIRAAGLVTGKPAITADGFLYRDEATVIRSPRLTITLETPAGVAHGVPRLTLDVTDRVVYGRVGPLATSHVPAGQSSASDRIIGLNLRREGLLTFSSPRDEGGWSFDGAPVCDGRRLYVAMRHSDVTPHAYVACFDAATGARLWRTSIGAADTPAGGMGDEITHNLLTLVENRIYLNTNLGLVAAIDADTGDIGWLSRYDRLAVKSFTPTSLGPLHFDRDPAPCLYHDGLLIVAPSDAPTIFALDADTGKKVWQQNQLPDALHLLGVVGGHLIASGPTLSSLDIASGHIEWIWPDSDRAGIRGLGRGLVAGNEVFWPTRNEIYVIDPQTGAQTRSPIKLAPLTGGANLAVSQGRLIAAGYDRLMVFGPPASPAPESPRTSNAQSAVSDQSEIK